MNSIGGANISSGMKGIQLSNRRELVEQLDSLPLFEYLIQHGALDEKTSQDIKDKASDAKVNLALLKHLEVNAKFIPLFLNGLRHTGQHQLANLLDESQRIQPTNSPGYLRKGRHKGQIGLYVTVKAIRLSRSAIPSSGKEWINLDEITITVPSVRPPAYEQMVIDESSSPGKKKSCFCGCFPKFFSRGKSKEHDKIQRDDSTQNSMTSKRNSNHNNGANTVHEDPVPEPIYLVGQTKSDKQEADRKEKMIIFKEKAKSFYNAFNDSYINTKTAMLKYFEQERGTLVLNMNTHECLEVNIILMRVDHLSQLKKDYRSGTLIADLERCLVSDEILTKIEAKGLKLNIELSQDDLYLADNEFF